MIQVDTKLSCFIELEGEEAYIYVNITDNVSIITLEYANITDELNDFIEINKYYELYKDENELIGDLEKGHIQRVLGQPKDDDRLDLISNLRMKMRHKNGTCDDSCILCNPDIGDDPFPDFMFNIRNIDTEGKA
jgi:phosphopantothenate synthetase